MSELIDNDFELTSETHEKIGEVVYTIASHYASDGDTLKERIAELLQIGIQNKNCTFANSL